MGARGGSMQAGDRLVERYRLGELLGAADMGVVWRATDELLGRTVALKRIGTALHGGDELERARRSLREGRIAAMLDHPRLLRILDVVIEADEPWLVLEHVAARSWASLLHQRGPFPAAGAAGIAAQVADALAALHGAGVVHGDVTLDNVLVCHGERVRLADFGLARVVGDDADTARSAMTGARALRAPEVAAGGPASVAADIFALGAAVYEAVEGIPPSRPGHRPVRRGADRLAPVLGALMAVDPAERPDAARARTAFDNVATGISPC